MKKVFKVALLLMCSVAVVGLYAQDVKIVRMGAPDTTKNPGVMYVRNLETGETTEIKPEILNFDESKIAYATPQEAYAATQKGGKAILVYIAKNKEDKLRGTSYVRYDGEEIKNIRSGKMKVNDVYVLAHEKKDAQVTAFLYAVSEGCKSVKVYVVDGGVEAWNRR